MDVKGCWWCFTFTFFCLSLVHQETNVSPICLTTEQQGSWSSRMSLTRQSTAPSATWGLNPSGLWSRHPQPPQMWVSHLCMPSTSQHQRATRGRPCLPRTALLRTCCCSPTPSPLPARRTARPATAVRTPRTPRATMRTARLEQPAGSSIWPTTSPPGWGTGCYLWWRRSSSGSTTPSEPTWRWPPRALRWWRRTGSR